MNREIKMNRSTNITITIMKSDNTPVANQEVTIEQTRHQFLFGTATFDFVPLASGDYVDKEK